MALTQEEKELYINGFNTIEDIIKSIRDRIDAGAVPLRIEADFVTCSQ